MQHYLLSFLLFTPLTVALVFLIIPHRFSHVFRTGTLVASIVQLFVLVAIANQYATDTSSMQLVEQRSWISLDLGAWGVLKAEYFVGVDGLSFPLVCLSVIVMMIACIASWNVSHQPKGYFILFLVLNAAVIGSFIALDFLLFFLFFEFMLLPMFFLIGIWGGQRREYASVKFFLYTLVGSIFILIAMIGLYLAVHEPAAPMTHTFNLLHMMDARNVASDSILHPQSTWMVGGWSARHWAFLLLFLGFAIKLPMVPVHTWLPDAHVEASTPVSVILAALLLKIGGYGLLRIALPVFPAEAMDFSLFIGIMGVISIVYGALNALASKDLKRLIAYSSVSHMGFVLLGMASFTNEGVSGAVYQLVSHGIITSMLFIIAGVIYDRTHDRTIQHYSGLAGKMPAFFSMTVIAFFASLGLPGFSGFIAEILILLGAFSSSGVNGLLHASLAVVATLGLLLAAGYYLWTLQRMFFGPFDVKGAIRPEALTDLTTRELVMLVPLALGTLLFGIFPHIMLSYINTYAKTFMELMQTSMHSFTTNS